VGAVAGAHRAARARGQDRPTAVCPVGHALKTVNQLLAAKDHLLKEGSAIDASLIAAPSSTKNSSGKRDSEMHQSKKGQQWHFGMKAHIGVDADSGLVHTVVGTAGHVSDVTQASQLLHGQESEVFTDAGYQGVEKRQETQGLEVNWQVAMRPSKRKALDKSSTLGTPSSHLWCPLRSIGCGKWVLDIILSNKHCKM